MSKVSRKNFETKSNTNITRNTLTERIKKAIDELRSRRSPIDARNFSEQIQEQLQNNPSVRFLPSENAFIYKPKYDVSDKEGLLNVLLDAWPHPCIQADLEDSYHGAARDLSDLRMNYPGVIWVVRNSATRNDQWYCSPNAFNQDVAPLINDGYKKLTEDEKTHLSIMWELMSDQVSQIEELDGVLVKLGIKPMKSQVFPYEEYCKRKRLEDYKEARGLKKRKRKQKVTNEHMLQQEEQPENPVPT